MRIGKFRRIAQIIICRIRILIRNIRLLQYGKTNIKSGPALVRASHLFRLRRKCFPKLKTEN